MQLTCVTCHSLVTTRSTVTFNSGTGTNICICGNTVTVIYPLYIITSRFIKWNIYIVGKHRISYLTIIIPLKMFVTSFRTFTFHASRHVRVFNIITLIIPIQIKCLSNTIFNIVTFTIG